MSAVSLVPMIDLRGAGTSLTPQRAGLLQALDAHGSISSLLKFGLMERPNRSAGPLSRCSNVPRTHFDL
ncbi:hypothetical protein [Thermomonas sp.]|uniref:hypothetical protein n=1 Tax=Thermomonas sp. TaxID=1971895 RepID=UPI003D120BD9